MEINSKTIHATFSQFFSGRKIGQTEQRPMQNWLRIIAFTACVSVVLCGVGVYQFFYEKSVVQEIVVTQGFSKNTLSKSRVDALLVVHQEQTARFTSARNSAPDAPDVGGVKTAAPQDVVEEPVAEEETPVEEENERPELVP